MRAVDGENLKFLAFDMPHPAWDITRRSIPWPCIGVSVGREPCLTRGKAFERAERDPGFGWSFAPKAGQDKSDDRNTYE